MNRLLEGLIGRDVLALATRLVLLLATLGAAYAIAQLLAPVIARVVARLDAWTRIQRTSHSCRARAVAR